MSTYASRHLGLAARWAAPFVLAAAVLAQAPVHAQTAALQAVPSVDLPRYMGDWYQIGFYPNSFQKQCVSGTTANYVLNANNTVTVTNTCTTAEGTPSVAVGTARVRQPKVLGIPVGPGTTSKLEVRFAPNYLAWIPLVWGPYWVIQLPEDYRYSVVSEPTRTYLWILSRTPQLNPADQANILATLKQQGFDTSKLVFQPQP